MEYYTYVNIFATKGLEYLLLICFFALFIFLLRYLSGPAKKDAPSDARNLEDNGLKSARR